MGKTFAYITMAIILLGCSLKKQDKKVAQNDQPNVHIGYYLKKLDNLLTQKIDSIHKANGITRVEWQILNGIAEKPHMERDDLLGIMKEFTDRSTAQNLIDGLEDKGLIAGSKELKLTASGQKTHTTSLKMQKEFRNKAMQGLTQKDYEKVISTLDKIIQNLSN